MVVYSLTLGPMFQANCYVAENDRKEAFAVDIGGDGEELLKFLKQNDLTLKKIFLTHGHFDHILGTAVVAEATGAEVYIHSDDAAMLTSERECLLSFMMRGAELRKIEKYTELRGGEEIDFCGTPVKVIHTPGHTRGGVCYVCEDIIFSGDTLFKNSIGRTDFPGGSSDTLKRSLKTLKELGENGADYKVYPGHDSKTTLSSEIKNNPYMRDLK